MIIDQFKGTMPNSLKELQQLYPVATVTSDIGTSEAEEAQGYTRQFRNRLRPELESTQDTANKPLVIHRA